MRGAACESISPSHVGDSVTLYAIFSRDNSLSLLCLFEKGMTTIKDSREHCTLSGHRG